MKISKQLITILILFSILPIFLVTGICITGFTKHSSDLINENIETAALTQSLAVKTFFKERESDIRIISMLPEIKFAYTLRSSGLNNTSPKKFEEVVSILNLWKSKQPYMNYISLVDKNNKIIASSDTENTSNYINLDANSINELKNSKHIVTRMNNNNSLKEDVILACPVKNNKQYAGYIICNLNMDFLKQSINNLKYFKTATIFIIDKNGSLLFAEGHDSANLTENYEKNLKTELNRVNISTYPRGSLSYTIDNIHKTAYYSNITGTKWVVLSSINKSEFQTPRDKIVRIILIIVLLLLATTIILYFFVTNNFKKPLHELLSSIQRMHNGDLTCRVTYLKRNEFGEIGKAFNQLITTVESNMRIQSEEKQKLTYASERDSLTGLYNKRTAENMIETELLADSAAKHALFMIDIDNFKLVNDSLGHMCGDILIQEIAKILQNCCAGSNITGRIGGDEFVLFLNTVENDNYIFETAHLILKQIEGIPIECPISSSIGIAVYPKDGKDFKTLYKHADNALYAVKKNGKNSYKFYDENSD